MEYNKNQENYLYSIGIDCGVKTGFAVWSVKEQKLVCVETKTIHDAINEVTRVFKKQPKIKVFIEDARLRKWLGKDAEVKKQGAGSVKRDAKIWEDFCKKNKIPYYLVNPLNNLTKVSSDTFVKMTKWKGRTSNHARDAALMVYGRNY